MTAMLDGKQDRHSWQTFLLQAPQHCQISNFYNTTGCYILCVKGLTGGGTSDKYITENCSYLEKLSRGDVVLADRGFNVKDTVGLYSAQLKIPAFTKGKQQLHPLELESTRDSLPSGSMLKESLAWSGTNTPSIRAPSCCLFAKQPLKDKMVTVCCALCNVCPSVVPTE